MSGLAVLVDSTLQMAALFMLSLAPVFALVMAIQRMRTKV